jgi:predicted RNA-binding protein with PUA-like domain
MQVGDRAFFYHSVVRPLGIYGIVEVVRPAYPDPTQFEPESKYYDPKATPSTPRWSAVDVRLLEFFEEPVTLDRLKACPELVKLEVTRKGSRLSVQPVGAEEWDFIVRKLASSPGK